LKEAAMVTVMFVVVIAAVADGTSIFFYSQLLVLCAFSVDFPVTLFFSSLES